MTPREVLDYARAAGVTLSITPDGLCCESGRPLPDHLRQLLKARKRELTVLLSGPPVPPWDQGEADRLLSELRGAIEEQRRAFGGKFPGPLATVVGDYLEIAQQYVANHEAEAGRGWDGLALLRDVRPRLLAIIRAANPEQRKAS